MCDELGIPCMSWDIHQGFDACDPNDFSAVETFEFIWSHPAYWRQKLYADDPRDSVAFADPSISSRDTVNSFVTAPVP